MAMMTQMGKIMIVAGLLLAVAGVAVYLLGRTGFRGLPGDIVYESDGTRIYFPIVTMLVLSVLASALLWLITWFLNR